MTFTINENGTFTIVDTELESNNEYLSQWLIDQEYDPEEEECEFN